MKFNPGDTVRRKEYIFHITDIEVIWYRNYKGIGERDGFKFPISHSVHYVDEYFELDRGFTFRKILKELYA